jgi:hypothetical protein
MLQPTPQVLQAQTQQSQPVTNQPPPIDPFWSVVGQYGVGAAALLAILKAYADYQLKSAMEDRAQKTKENAQSLELEGRVFGSLLSQQESSVTSTNQLLNAFIARTLNQAETTNEQTSSLITTIATLTEAIKSLGDTQHSQTAILYELKEYSESHHSELAAIRNLRDSILNSLEVNRNLSTRILALMEELVYSLSRTNINPKP